MAQLQAGTLVILPTETVYGLAADPAAPGAVDALQQVKGRGEQQPFTHHLASYEQLGALAPAPPARIARMLQRLWPGPLTLIVPGHDGTEVGLRVPAHAFTQAVIDAVGHGLLMSSANRHGAPPCNDAASLTAAFGAEPSVALFADAGPPQLGEASAVVRLRGRRLEVLRPGLLSADELFTAAAARVLFVCTGNTCRSPLAEALLRHLAAKRLGVAADQVLAHGLCARSAGTGTMPGMPASAGAVAAAAELGIDLSGHRSSLVSDHLLRAADRILCLSPSHAAVVCELAPDAAERVELLDPAGGGVSDPFGAGVEVYRQTRNEIARHIEARLDALL